LSKKMEFVPIYYLLNLKKSL